jgi:hypothetical protein
MCKVNVEVMQCNLKQSSMPSRFQLLDLGERAGLSLSIFVQQGTQTFKSSWTKLVLTHDQGCHLPESAAIFLKETMADDEKMNSPVWVLQSGP